MIAGTGERRITVRNIFPNQIFLVISNTVGVSLGKRSSFRLFLSGVLLSEAPVGKRSQQDVRPLIQCGRTTGETTPVSPSASSQVPALGYHLRLNPLARAVARMLFSRIRGSFSASGGAWWSGGRLSSTPCVQNWACLTRLGSTNRMQTARKFFHA